MESEGSSGSELLLTPPIALFLNYDLALMIIPQLKFHNMPFSSDECTIIDCSKPPEYLFLFVDLAVYYCGTHTATAHAQDHKGMMKYIGVLGIDIDQNLKEKGIPWLKAIALANGQFLTLSIWNNKLLNVALRDTNGKWIKYWDSTSWEADPTDVITKMMKACL